MSEENGYICNRFNHTEIRLKLLITIQIYSYTYVVSALRTSIYYYTIIYYYALLYNQTNVVISKQSS